MTQVPEAVDGIIGKPPSESENKTMMFDKRVPPHSQPEKKPKLSGPRPPPPPRSKFDYSRTGYDYAYNPFSYPILGLPMLRLVTTTTTTGATRIIFQKNTLLKMQQNSTNEINQPKKKLTKTVMDTPICRLDTITLP
jgi:hypothetical protein